MRPVHLYAAVCDGRAVVADERPEVRRAAGVRRAPGPDQPPGPVAAVTTFYRRYWTNRARRRDRHAEHQAAPLTVYDLLLQAWSEGRAVALDWPGQDMTGLVRERPVGRRGHTDSTGADEDTEPTTAAREARRWLSQEWFSSAPQALAG